MLNRILYPNPFVSVLCIVMGQAKTFCILRLEKGWQGGKGVEGMYVIPLEIHYVGWTLGADTMSVKRKLTKPLGFFVVLWHYRLNGGRKDIRLIKIQ